MANPGTRICFRVGDQDAKRFEDGFSYFEAKDLQNLGIGEAIVRIDRPEFDFNLKTSPLPEAEHGEERMQAIIARSDAKWELQNIQKCLTAGYALVVQLSTDKKYLESIQREIEKSLDAASRTKVMISEPEAFFAYLDMEIAKEASTETRILLFNWL